jgi:uroporphyrin-III C-methyltransferase
MGKGKVYLVGAGPGDEKLITVKGLECIQKSDCIVYDRLINSSLLDYAPQYAEKIFCGKFPGKHMLIQEEIHELLVQKASEGKTVTRLKGGDPSVFGRVGEEAVVLKEAGIPFEIVPGITSSIAAAEYAGIPVTHREFASSFALVTGHGREEKGTDFLNWKALATGIDTIAFYMGVGNLENICKKLIEFGKPSDTPVAIIENGTTIDQRTITGTLQTIYIRAMEEKITNPAMIIVGNVVKVREKASWYEDLIEQTKEISLI